MVRVWLGVIAVGVSIVLFASSAVLQAAVPDMPGAGGAQIVPESVPPRTGIWPVNWTFYGSAGSGWGLTSTSLSNPGPTLTVYRGDIVNLTLISTDSTSVKHSWFIDLNGDNLADGNEPSSPDFTSAQALVWNFTADQSGSWIYKCGYHQTSMTGTIMIVGGPPIRLPPQMAIPLITGIMLGALGVVLVFAVVYHVRAVRAAKRVK